MDIVEQLESLLPLSYPFSISRIEKNEELKQVHIYLEVCKDYRPSPHHSIHSYYDRSWEHLRLFQYRSFLHCRLPVFLDRESGKTAAMEAGFSREHSRFTLLYEQRVLELMQLHCCFTSVAAQLGIYPQRVENIYHHYTTEAYLSHTASVCERVGIDETSTRKGHDYITIFTDMDAQQVIAIEDGRSGDAIGAFFTSHANPAAIRELSMDMSPAFIKGVQEHLPWASITFDKWHVFKLFERHLQELDAKLGNYRELIFAYLQDFYQQRQPKEAMAQLTFMADWIEEVAGTNKLSKTIRQHAQGLVNHITSRLTNGLLEGINSKIQAIKRIARGFRYTDNFKKLILFAFGKITFDQVNS